MEKDGIQDGQWKKYIPTKGMLQVRILAGVYLLCLTINMCRNYSASAGAERVIVTAAIAGFPVIGALLIGFSVRSLKIGRYAVNK